MNSDSNIFFTFARGFSKQIEFVILGFYPYRANRMASPKVTHKHTIDVVANPRKEKGLTPKQEEFCRLYVCEDLTQTECAVQAGYAKNGAHVIASRLLDGKTHPMVTQRIYELKKEMGRKYEVTFESHVKTLAKIRDEALQNGHYASAVAAEKSRGQAAGLYIDRKEILHGKIDQMSKEDVLKEIAKLQQEYPSLAQGVVIEHDAEQA